jgi:hypothetical protein
MPQKSPKMTHFDPKIPLNLGIFEKNITKKQYNKVEKYEKIDFLLGNRANNYHYFEQKNYIYLLLKFLLEASIRSPLVIN